MWQFQHQIPFNEVHVVEFQKWKLVAEGMHTASTTRLIFRNLKCFMLFNHQEFNSTLTILGNFAFTSFKGNMSENLNLSCGFISSIWTLERGSCWTLKGPIWSHNKSLKCRMKTSIVNAQQSRVTTFSWYNYWLITQMWLYREGFH